VFPVRYEMDFYTSFRRKSVFKVLKSLAGTLSHHYTVLVRDGMCVAYSTTKSISRPYSVGQ
jgi:hypothetical protein